MSTAAAAPPSLAVALFGTEEPAPGAVALRAGPLEASLGAGNLRHLRLHGREAVRGVGFVVRDRGWGTYTPEITSPEVRQDGRGFLVTYDALCRDASQALRYRARIEGRADGGLAFEVAAGPETDFVTNRTGFVVLHGIEGTAGEPVEVERVDGTVERARFPRLVDPVQPFKDVRALTHEVLPGLRVTCRMEGDAYETEDQRNWTEASYKTYVRPLARPWPYVLAKGQGLTQRVSLEVVGTPARASPAARAGGGEGDVTVRLGATLPPTMPPVGLEVPPDRIEDALAASDLLRQVRHPHVVVSLIRGLDEVDLQTSVRQMAAYAELLRRCGDPSPFLEATIPCRDPDGRPTADAGVMRRDLERLAAVVSRAGLRFEVVAVSPACALRSHGPGGAGPPAPCPDHLHAALRELFPGARIAGGTSAYFTELNRTSPLPAAGDPDLVRLTTCPIVHAADDLSLVETLEALPSVFASARALAGGLPLWLFPTAISMRHNPHGAAPAGNPDRGRVATARADPRERALIGAAWYAGYLANAARAGLAGVALAAAAGPSAIVHTPGNPAAPPWFDAAGAVVYPSYHVLRGHARLAGLRLVAAETDDPRGVQVLAAATPAGIVAWLSNLTGRPRRIRVEDAPSSGGTLIRRLDADSFAPLCRDPEAFDGTAAAASPDWIELGPYAVARLDLPG